MPKFVLESKSDDIFKNMSQEDSASAPDTEATTSNTKEPATTETVAPSEVKGAVAPVKEATDAKEPPTKTAPEDAPQPLERVTPSYEDIKDALDRQRTDTMAKLMEAYSLSAEDAEVLSVEPQKVLPKLAAQVFYDTYTALWATVVSQFPALASQYEQITSAYNKYENQFFERWPQLSEHRQTAEQAVRAYRQANPQATPKDVIEKGGLLAMFSSGLLPQETSVQQKTPERPHMPIQPGGIGSSTKGVQKNIFTEMAEEELREDII